MSTNVEILAGNKVLLDLLEQVNKKKIDQAKELPPIASGALPAIPVEPVGQDYKMSISGGLNGATFTGVGMSPVTLGKHQNAIAYYDGKAKVWSVVNKQDLPKVPVKNEFGLSIEDAASQKLVTDLKNDFDSKIKLISNTEFIYALVDSNDVLLWGKRRDGTTYDCDLSIYNYTDSQISMLNSVIEELADNVGNRLDDLDGSISELYSFKNDINNKLSIISNDEFIYAIVDANGVLLWGKRRDGTTYDCDVLILDKINTLNKKVGDLESKVTVISNAEFLYAIVDINDVLLWGKRRDGTTYDCDTSGSAEIDALKKRLDTYDTTMSIISNPEYMWAIVDKDGVFIEGIYRDGSVHILKLKADELEVEKLKMSESALTDLQIALKKSGFTSGTGDWSDKSRLRLPIPRVPAIVNLTIPALPTTKTQDFKGEIEYWDYEGNYFKKPIVLNAQGNSSLIYIKKNFTLDLDDVSKIKFGDWVEQDSWHLKAHYTDAFKSNNNVAYDIFEELSRKRMYTDSRVWDYTFKKESNQGAGVLKNDFDTGARGFPDGFPVSLYHNGEFYGIYMFNLKKHRDNYKMDRGNINHIHLDGSVGPATMFNGNIDWTAFEIRNPNPRLKQEGWELLDIDGNKYDGDNPKELSNDGNSGLVKQAIIRLSTSLQAVKANQTKETFETYFTNKWMFSQYLHVANVVGNIDGFDKNWQWVTYDATLWGIAPYDWDGGLGVDHIGNTVDDKYNTTHLGVNGETPMKYYWLLYQDEAKASYQELKNSGFFTAKNIFSFYKRRIDWIGFENFDKENKKWANMPSYRKSGINENWTLKSKDRAHVPSNYNNTTTYQQGDEVVYGTGDERYFFIAKNTTTGSAPLDILYPTFPRTLGFYNSMSRIEKWLENRINFTDSIYNN